MSYRSQRKGLEKDIEKTISKGSKIFMGLIIIFFVSLFMSFMVFSFVQTGLFILSDTTINLLGRTISFNIKSFLFLTLVFLMVLGLIFFVGVAIED